MGSKLGNERDNLISTLALALGIKSDFLQMLASIHFASFLVLAIRVLLRGSGGGGGRGRRILTTELTKTRLIGLHTSKSRSNRLTRESPFVVIVIGLLTKNVWNCLRSNRILEIFYQVDDKYYYCIFMFSSLS